MSRYVNWQEPLSGDDYQPVAESTPWGDLRRLRPPVTIPGVPMLSFLFAIIFLGEHPSVHEVRGMLIAIGSAPHHPALQAGDVR